MCVCVCECECVCVCVCVCVCLGAVGGLGWPWGPAQSRELRA